jgi:vacuolar-type H+-ATPase subunit I/STV1
MPDVTDSVRKAVLREISETNRKKAELDSTEKTDTSDRVKEEVDVSPKIDTSLDMASALSRMNLFEETMVKQEKEDKELDEVKEIYREKIQKEVMTDKSLDIIQRLGF